MRFSLRVLGLDLFDLTVSTDEDTAPEYDQARDLSGGTLGSTPVGFTARWERTDDAEMPERG